jgi:cell division protein FtsI/penicillin-binding protein 2
MTEREYRGKIYDAKKRLVAVNYQAIDGFIKRKDVLVEHWTIQNYEEEVTFDKRCEDELLEMLEEKYPFLSFTLEDGEVRWKLKRAR